MIDRAAKRLGFTVSEAPFAGDKDEILKGTTRAIQLLDQKTQSGYCL
jgi:hypothetical protein